MKTTLKFCITANASLFIGGIIYFCLQGTPYGDSAVSRRIRHGAGQARSLLASGVVHVAASRLSFSEPVRDLRDVSGASLRAEPWLTDNGTTVTVSWENIHSPSISQPFDWVGLYCTSGADGRAYLDYSFISESPTHAEGRGSLKFVLYNLRTDCEFRYYQNSTLTTLLAVSNKVNFRGGKSRPLRGHLALTEDPTQMRVSWTTGSSTRPVVYYGLSRDNLTLSATGTSKTYTISDLCGPPANDSSFFVDPGSLHDVLLTNLKPKTMYYYKYGSGVSFSEVKNFTTAVVAGDTTRFKFIMYGDMGLSSPPGAETTAQLVLNEVLGGAAFVMHQGDLSYALGRAVKWDTWMNLIEPYASLAPYMIGIGNHEYDHEVGGSKDPSHTGGEGFHPEWGNFGYDSAGECGVPPFYRFHMPDNGNSVFWYSFDYGLVHFTVISTEHDFTPGSPMYSWIEKDFQSVNRN
ncbi:Probable inactive purple acid phosphatase 9 [Geodia barretti]|uniref:Probable inactive purple acid phosphatase 9 n=1 Tax=Geodia barretti TaxID=519541 RepID=A0AA35T2N1_GEOBA|nr:Probable inactive purple acid phosphatase 9 [Geodia barretti]